jgi:hypothetical protein
VSNPKSKCPARRGTMLKFEYPMTKTFLVVLQSVKPEFFTLWRRRTLRPGFSLKLFIGPKFNVSEILQLVEIKDLLIAPGLCHFHGIMERWVIKTEKIIYKLFFFLQTHFSSIPSFSTSGG